MVLQKGLDRLRKFAAEEVGAEIDKSVADFKKKTTERLGARAQSHLESKRGYSELKEYLLEDMKNKVKILMEELEALIVGKDKEILLTTFRSIVGSMAGF